MVAAGAAACGSSSGSGGSTTTEQGASSRHPFSLDAGRATPVGDSSLPRKLYIANDCAYDVWTFALPVSTLPDSAPLKVGAGEAVVMGWSDDFSGRIWPRSGCTGAGSSLQCAQSAYDTLAEFTLTRGMDSDWYDISLVDGFTIPLAILQLDAAWTPSSSYVPGGKLGSDAVCGSPVCATDLLLHCPASQQRKDASGAVVACVNGQNPGPIQEYFKTGCPTAYSWPYDDPQSLFTCPDYAQNGGVGARDYEIVYCPPQGSTPGFP
jgi:hypothetical protein